MKVSRVRITVRRLMIAVALLGAGFALLLVLFPELNPLPTGPVTRSFEAKGVKTVVLRAADADTATVVTEARDRITVTGHPVGGAAGYHSADPFWRETPPQRWGLDFEFSLYGDTLVISSVKEILYVHHHYQLTRLELKVPPGVKVVKQKRELTGDGNPDLSKPEALQPSAL